MKGAFSRDLIGPLAQVEGIMKAVDYKKILQDTMLPHAKEKMSLDWIYMQDNDPKHSAKIVQKWFRDNNVKKLDWPAQSPDLNPIEHLWEHLDRQIRARSFSKTSELMSALKEEWDRIPLDVLIGLMDSMPRRCQAVIDAKGYSTKY